jgi:hypothetical protein
VYVLTSVGEENIWYVVTYIFSTKTVQKSFIFRTVLLFDSITLQFSVLLLNLHLIHPFVLALTLFDEFSISLGREGFRV